LTLLQFDIYISKYLQSFPELSENDFPKFTEFDLNGNGEVTFSEWRGYLKLQKKLKPSAAEKELQKPTPLSPPAPPSEPLQPASSS
jgi:hypothetical protein